MAITFVASEVNAADTATASWSGSTNTAIAIPQPSGLQTNDLLLVVCCYRDANVNIVPAFAATGGQDWQNEFGGIAGSTAKLHGSWCRYNGTWGSPTLFVRDNQLDTVTSGTNPIVVATFAFRSSVAGHSLYQETMGSMAATYAAPAGPPYNVSTTAGDFGGGHESRKSPESNTVGIYFFTALDDVAWTFQTAGWTSAFSGTDQIRRSLNTSISAHYQIKSDGTAFANVTNQQDSTIGPDSGAYAFMTFSERPDSDFTDLLGSTSRYFPGSLGSFTDGHLDQFSFNNASRSQFNTDWVFSGTEASLGFWVYFRSFTANDDPRLWVRHRTDRPLTGTRYLGGGLDLDYSWFIGIEPPQATQSYPKLRVRWNNSTVTGVASTTAGQFLQGQWQYVLCTFNRSAGTIGGYLDATSVSFNGGTGYNTTDWNTANTHKVVIGNNAPFDVPSGAIRDNSADCYIAHPAAWNKILTANEATALFNGVDPRSIQSNSLIFYVPDMGANSTTDRDIIGGRTSTVYNAPGRAFGPPKFKKRSAATYTSTYS